MTLVAASLNAADEPSTTTPSKKRNKTVPDNVTAASLDPQGQNILKRAHHLAEKGANIEFLKSPQGIAFKDQLAALDQEINDVYEKYLNIFREDPATEKGKKLREERERLLQALSQKQRKIEADYENLKNNSPAYRAMVEKHLKGELHHMKGKLKAHSLEKGDDKQ
jgi:hypothetical protein